MHKRTKHSDAIMTGILVTKFKMGQIDVKDLAEMAADESRAEMLGCEKSIRSDNRFPIYSTDNKPCSFKVGLQL